MTVFLALATQVLQHFFLDLTWGQFWREKYEFNKNNPYVKNIPLLMSLLPKLKSIFSIVTVCGIMQYKFENRAVTKVPKKLVIAATNLLVCYLIVEINYADPFLVSKLIVLGIKFEVSRETNFINDNPAKPGK